MSKGDPVRISKWFRMTLSVFEIILGVENQVAEHERKSAVTQNILEFGVKPKK